MFDVDFYPTPRPVIEQMCFGLELTGKTILEPSAGSGNIISYLKEHDAKVIACERHPDLAVLASKKANKFLKHDFLQVTREEISHIDAIVMNPPFTNDEKHIMHAWDIAPEGCEIVALCNNSTLTNSYSYTRKDLKQLIARHGSSLSLGEVFSTAERKTNVEIGLVKLFKPKTGDSEFAGYLFDMDEDAESQVNGIMRFDEIRNIVNRYIGAVKMFNEVDAMERQMNQLIKPINEAGKIYFGVTQRRDGKEYSIDREEFKKELQKSAWKSIFNKMNMDYYVTKSVMGDINKYVEQQIHVPFTMKNIYKMIEIIVGTHGSRMEKVLVDAFDKICSFSHENSEAGQGWKTNSSYKVNQKFILPWIVNSEYGHLSIRYHAWEQANDMDDIVKALCYLTGKKYVDLDEKGNNISKFDTLHNFVSNTKEYDVNGKVVKESNGYSDKYRRLDFGKWYKWNEFFEIRGYKKGTMHVRFIDTKVWMEFNRRVAKIKGWALPKNTDTKTKGTERTRKTGVKIY
jgi:predicted RNA methylase